VNSGIADAPVKSSSRSNGPLACWRAAGTAAADAAAHPTIATTPVRIATARRARSPRTHRGYVAIDEKAMVSSDRRDQRVS
jgi:hypothetical protein